jgi:hypothetical protein
MSYESLIGCCSPRQSAHSTDLTVEPTFLCLSKDTWKVITAVATILSIIGGLGLMSYGLNQAFSGHILKGSLEAATGLIVPSALFALLIKQQQNDDE